MAKATKRDDVTEVVVVEKGGVTLELSNEEAEILRTAIGFFAYDSLTRPIWDALLKVGVEYGRYTFINDEFTTHPSVRKSD